MASELTNEERRQLDPVVDALMTWRGDGTRAWNDLIAGVERILTAREAAAERRGAVNALREAADDARAVSGLRTRWAASSWLRERADRSEAGDG